MRDQAVDANLVSLLLASHPQLTSLDLSGNEIYQLQGLDALSTLTSLDLSNNCLSDASAVSVMTALKELRLGANQL